MTKEHNIEFKIKGIEYTIDDITIAQYYKIQHLLIVEGADAKLQIVSYLSGCPIEDLKTLETYLILVTELIFLNVTSKL